MKKETSAGAVIFYRKDKKIEYLLLNYLGGHWDFPKGHIELHENTIKTALREIKEETNLNVKIIRGFQKKITYSFHHKGELIIKEVIFYLAKAETQKIILSEEHKGYVWLDFKKAYELITFNKEILKDADKFLKRFFKKAISNKNNLGYKKNFKKKQESFALSKTLTNLGFKSRKEKPSTGFTLIEILITIAMILTIFALGSQIFNPSSYSQKIRDTKRIADLKSLEVALNTYLLSIIDPRLGPINTGIDEATPTIFISVPFDKEDKRTFTIIWSSTTYSISQVSSTEIFKNDGNGWLPINLSILVHIPLFSLPSDPINSHDQKYFYSYVFKSSSLAFEINANLEYPNYRNNGSESKTNNDGGDNDNLLEVGSDKTLMPNNLY